MKDFLIATTAVIVIASATPKDTTKTAIQTKKVPSTSKKATDKKINGGETSEDNMLFNLFNLTFKFQ